MNLDVDEVRFPDGSTGELELIRQYLERKLGRRLEGKLDDPREVQRLTQRLMRAGFSAARIRDALGKVAANPAWLEGLDDPSETFDE